jgi:ribosomal protein L40E
MATVEGMKDQVIELCLRCGAKMEWRHQTWQCRRCGFKLGCCEGECPND